MGDPVFFINDKDRKKYLKILVDYFKFYHQKVDTEAALLAEKAFDNLVYGLDLDGEPVPDNIKYFDNRHIRVKCTFVNGKYDGEYILYHSNGQIADHSYWKNDTKIKDLLKEE